MPLIVSRLLAAALAVFLLLGGVSSEYIPPPAPMPPPEIGPARSWTAAELERPPNVIIVLSESFWDITQLNALSFSRDPAPYFHALQKEFTHGTLLSPMFGGGTANVEMEVLTGHSMRFFPQDSIVYEDVFKQPTGSLAHILNGQGYTTTAISPFHRWFFNSSEVYKYLGFSRFISLEYFDPDEYAGPYIGDHAVAKRIIEESDRSPGADFIFANTMENHYHYWPGKFKRNTIDVKGNVSAQSLGIAATYAQGMNGADRMLGELVTHFSQVKEPTILVFFGDHLPSLEKYSVYEDAGYITGENDPDFLEKMHHVPVLVWNNYLPRTQKEELRLSPSFLGPYVLNLAGRPGSAYTEFLGSLARRMPVLPPEDHYAAMHINPADAELYRLKQKDVLEAEKRGGVTPGAAFTLGYGPPTINRTVPEQIAADASGGTPLVIEGGRYGLGSTVFVNGEALPTQWKSEHSLAVILPFELIQAGSALDVDVRTLDSKGQTLDASSAVRLPVRTQ